MPTAISYVAGRLLEHGVTAFCPTLVTSQPSIYHRILPLLNACKTRRDAHQMRAAILGLSSFARSHCRWLFPGAHLEGPFISKAKKGAHPDEHILEDFGLDVPSRLAEVYGSLEGVAMITLAPELPGAIDAIGYLVARDIVVSIGHSSAGLASGEAAIAAGARCITHLFNAMQSVRCDSAD